MWREIIILILLGLSTSAFRGDTQFNCELNHLGKPQLSNLDFLSVFFNYLYEKRWNHRVHALCLVSIVCSYKKSILPMSIIRQNKVSETIILLTWKNINHNWTFLQLLAKLMNFLLCAVFKPYVVLRQF